MRPPAPSSSKCATTYKAALTWALLGADCNSFRLSIEWSRLYPRQGELNKAAVERYNAIFDTLERCGRSQRPRLFQKAATRCSRKPLLPAGMSGCGQIRYHSQDNQVAGCCCHNSPVTVSLTVHAEGQAGHGAKRDAALVCAPELVPGAGWLHKGRKCGHFRGMVPECIHPLWCVSMLPPQP